jgi:hypothetical protein
MICCLPEKRKSGKGPANWPVIRTRNSQTAASGLLDACSIGICCEAPDRVGKSITLDESGVRRPSQRLLVLATERSGIGEETSTSRRRSRPSNVSCSELTPAMRNGGLNFDVPMRRAGLPKTANLSQHRPNSVPGGGRYFRPQTSQSVRQLISWDATTCLKRSR